MGKRRALTAGLVPAEPKEEIRVYFQCVVQSSHPLITARSLPLGCNAKLVHNNNSPETDWHQIFDAPHTVWPHVP